MEGWVKLHRSLVDNGLWLSEPFSRGQAWVDMLILANHESSFFYVRGIKVNVERGQLGWSEPRLAERWKWSRTKLRNFLKDLEKEQQIIQQKGNVTQILTIVNYEKYQQKEQQTIQQKNSRKTAEEQQKDVNKNDKNDKNENKEINNTYPTLETVKTFFIINGYSTELAEKFYNGYSIADWKDSKGQKVKNWKQKAIHVWFKDDNKIKPNENGKQTKLTEIF